MDVMMLSPIAIDNLHLSRLRHGAVMVRAPISIIEVTGPGALACLQGVLTNDLVKPGDGSFVYSATLTPKGMIIADMWVVRIAPQRLLLLGDPAAHQSTLGVLRRSMPARMALVNDLTGGREALWLCGDLAIVSLAAAGLAVPDGDSRVLLSGQGAAESLVGRPHAAAPFRAVVVGPAGLIDRAELMLGNAGALPGDLDDLEAARILSGWPRLGAEIQERTLPQEVRYEDIQGLSYTKGCYTGQEIVARLHFRGHTNRELRGLIWSGVPDLAGDGVLGPDGELVGTIGSLLVLPRVTAGLAVIRREVEVGDRVTAAGHEATVVGLPFDPATLPG
jgi:folate-binding protein YgfZ